MKRSDVECERSWEEYMRAGEFSRAWEISDQVMWARRDKPCWNRPRHEQYIWTGAALDGQRVLIRCYHGLGDTVQFIRYVPLVMEQAKKVAVWAQPVLLPILQTIDSRVIFLPLHDGQPEGEYDVNVELMELPHVFRSTLEKLPSVVPYLFAEPLLRFEPRKLLHVGLVWKSGDWNSARSISLEELHPLFGLSGVCWHTLQLSDALAGWRDEWGTHSGRERVEDLARVMRTLDLVVSVDSFPAHLAGALGVPVWLLLSQPADWRWLAGASYSPWYLTMRIFSQEEPGEWRTVVRAVETELTKTLSNHQAGRA